MVRKRWFSGVVAVAVVLAASVTPAVAAADEARVVGETRVGPRTLDLEIASPALGGNAPVRLLLPPGWSPDADRTWPVLYLFHGCCEVQDYKSWTHYTDVEELTEGEDVLVVMPTGGKVGMHSKWWNFGWGDPPDWETFHVTELIRILEQGYRAGPTRVAAGLSIGGYGALAYAFRHRGTFRAAASYSGIPNTLWGAAPLTIQGMLLREGFNPLALWGNEYAMRWLWQEHNPYDHVEQLRGTALYVSAGNGTTGPLDPPGKSDQIEPVSLGASKSFTDRLTQHGIPVTVNYYGNGTHSWEYWQRELHTSWPFLAEHLNLR